MRLIALAISVAGLCSTTWAAERDENNERLDDAADLFKEIMGSPDKSIPQDLLNKSSLHHPGAGLEERRLSCWRPSTGGVL